MVISLPFALSRGTILAPTARIAGLVWVKTGKSRSEQMFSGLSPKADSDLRVNEYTPWTGAWFVLVAFLPSAPTAVRPGQPSRRQPSGYTMDNCYRDRLVAARLRRRWASVGEVMRPARLAYYGPGNGLRGARRRTRTRRAVAGQVGSSNSRRG